MSDLATISEYLEYCPETGLFRWKIIPFKGEGKCTPGWFAGTKAHCGYRKVGILGKQYYAHRLAWLFQTGEWPVNRIDHINCDGSDNRWVNLREATVAQNAQNRGKTRANTSGYKGVTWDRNRGQFKASINTGDGKTKFLGRFKTAEEASEAYKRAVSVYHGEFARTD